MAYFPGCLIPDFDGAIFSFALPALQTPPVHGTSVQRALVCEHQDAAEGIRRSVAVAGVQKRGATFHVNARLASSAAIVAEQRETTACPGAMLDLHFDPIRARLFTDAGTRLR